MVLRYKLLLYLQTFFVFSSNFNISLECGLFTGWVHLPYYAAGSLSTNLSI